MPAEAQAQPLVPEPVPAARRPEQRPIPGPETHASPRSRERLSNEEVEQRFRDAFSVMDETPDEDLSPTEKANKKLIKEALGKTLDKEPKEYKRSVSFKIESGRRVSQQEGIPVDGLIDFLTARTTADQNITPELKQKYQEYIQFLQEHSKSYVDINGSKHTNPVRWAGRVLRELKRLKQEGLTGDDETENKRLASQVMEERRELQFRQDRQPPPPPPPPPPEDVRYEFMVVNRQTDIEKRARETAENQLQQRFRELRGWNPVNLFRRSWLRITEEYRRQTYIDRARTAMLENNNSLMDVGLIRSAATNANANRAQEQEAGLAKVRQIQTEQLISGQRVEDLQGGQVRTEILRDVIRPIANGALNDPQEVQRLLRDIIQNHQNDPQIQRLFGADANQFGRAAEYFASDLLETGLQMRQNRQAHEFSLQELDRISSIKVANSDWAAETIVRFSAPDTIVAFTQRHRALAPFLTPAFVGGAFSLVGFFGTRGLGRGLSYVAGPVSGFIAGGALAAMRRSRDLKIDMGSHKVERTYNMQIEPDSRRRDKLERYTYATASTADLLNGRPDRPGVLAGDSRGLNELLANLDANPTITDSRNAVLRRISEIKTRLDFSAQNDVDLITYAERGQVEQGRLQLIQAIVEARQRLIAAGMTGPEIQNAETDFTGQWNARFTENVDQQNNAFRNYRLRSSLYAFAGGGVAGLAVGLLPTEALAEVARHTPLGELPVISAFKGQTAAENLVQRTGVGKLFGHPEWGKPPSGEVIDLLKGHNGSHESWIDHHRIRIPNGTEWLTDKQHHGRFDLVLDSNKHLNLVKDAFIKNNQFHYNHEHSLITDPAQQIIRHEHSTPGTTHWKKENVLGPDGLWNKHAANISRVEGYAYNTPWSDHNELDLHTFKNGSTMELRMLGMGEGYEKDLPNVYVPNVEHVGHSAYAFFLPGHESDPIVVQANHNGILALNPLDHNLHHVVNFEFGNGKTGHMQAGEFARMMVDPQKYSHLANGDIATEVNHNYGAFKLGGADGRGTGLISAGRMVTLKDGSHIWESFATIHGNGTTSPIEIPTHVPGKTEFSWEIKGPFEIRNPIPGAPLLDTPVWPRLTLEELAYPTQEQIQTPVGAPPETGNDRPRLRDRIREGIAEGARRARGRDNNTDILRPDRNPQETGTFRGDRLNSTTRTETNPEALDPADFYTPLEMLQREEGDVDHSQPYFVENVPDEINLTGEQMQDLQLREPFFVNITNNSYETNQQVVPFVWQLEERQRDTRYLRGEALTSGDSGILGLAAASAETPEQQAKLFELLSRNILRVHQQNPELFSEWLNAQGDEHTPDQLQAGHLSSLDLFKLHDLDRFRRTRRAPDRLFEAGEDRWTIDRERTAERWREFIVDLDRLVTRHEPLYPVELRRLEILAHSVDVGKLVEIIQEQSALANANPGATTPADPAAPQDTNDFVPEGTFDAELPRVELIRDRDQARQTPEYQQFEQLLQEGKYSEALDYSINNLLNYEGVISDNLAVELLVLNTPPDEVLPTLQNFKNKTYKYPSIARYAALELVVEGQSRYAIQLAEDISNMGPNVLDFEVYFIWEGIVGEQLLRGEDASETIEKARDVYSQMDPDLRDFANRGLDRIIDIYEYDAPLAPVADTDTFEHVADIPELKAQIQSAFKDFQALRGEENVEVVGTFPTAGKYFWQEIRFGPERITKSDDAYRGYLMINPEDMPQVLALLKEIGQKRLSEGKRTDFKWLLMTYGASDFKDLGKNIGSYKQLEETAPRIALYGDSVDEIKEVLEELSANPRWKEFEQHRLEKMVGRLPHRRPGTNAFIDNTGREWRTLNYNDKPGYSEDEAAESDWRDRKQGAPTI